MTDPIFSYTRPLFGDSDDGRDHLRRATTDLVYSAEIGTNADQFPKVIALHVPLGATVADVTYGEGVFWRKVPADAYRVLPTDIQTGVDLRKLPYADGSIDCVVMDPPYQEGLFRRTTVMMAGNGTHASFRTRYSNGQATPDDGSPKWHAAVIDLYRRGGHEAFRVLRSGGKMIVKVGDETSTNANHLTHLEVVTYYTKRIGFDPDVDLFVLVRPTRPATVGIERQVHARKNHSYFLVFLKPAERRPRRSG